MANTYTWEFPTLQVYTDYAGKPDVVYIIHWFYNGVDETGVYKANLFGSNQIAPYASGSPFIPYNDLTKELVQGWMEETIGPAQVAQYQAKLDERIEFQKNPPIAMLPPPWMITPTPTVTPTPSFTPSPTATPVTPTPTPTEGAPVVTNSLPMPPLTPTPTPTETVPELTPTPTPTPAV